MLPQKKIHKFNILFSLYLIIDVLSESNYIKYAWIYSLLYNLRLVVLLFFAFYVFCQLKIKLNIALPIIICFVSILINMLFYGGGYSFFYIFIIVFAYSISQIEINNMIILVIKNTVFAELAVIISCLIGLIENEVTYRELSQFSSLFFQGTHARYYLGFINFNQLSHVYLDILILIISLKGSKIKLRECIALMIGAFIIFSVSNCRLEFLLGISIVFSIIILKCREKSCRAMKLLRKEKHYLWCIAPCIAFLSFFVAYTFDFSNWLFDYVNNFLSNRLHWSQMILQKYGSSTFSLFGYGKFAGTSDEEFDFIVDNGYIKEVLQRGVLVSGILIFIWAKIISYCQKNGDYYQLICVLSIVLANAVNETFISPRLIPFYCLFYSIYVNRGVKKKNI